MSGSDTTGVDTSAGLRLSPDVVTLLRCPACGSGLDTGGTPWKCSASQCGVEYPIVDGIPVLIDDDTSLFPRSVFVGGGSTTFSGSRGPLVQLLDRLMPGIGMNVHAKRNYARMAELLIERSPSPRVLIVGGSIEGKGLASLIAHSEIETVDTDVSLGPRTKVICDAHSLPFEDGSFDGAIAQAVLEHVIDPTRCVAEMQRVLKPGGIIYVETPFMQPVHGGRYDFTRFTALGHRRLLRAFTEIDSGAVCGPGMSLAYAWHYFLLSFTSGKAARRLVSGLARLTAWFWKYFDPYLIRNPAALDAASGVYFLGRNDGYPVADKQIVDSYRGGSA